MSVSIDQAATERFEASRARLASLAYRLLGSAADAEDVVQDAFLRWQAADRERFDVWEAWLTKVVTNLCLDRLRSASSRRERPSGPWMPEPLLDGDPMLGPADTAEQRESVSVAVLTLMEQLTPVERAVYVLREAFAYPHAEIAGFLDISESASQQHLHRARRRVDAVRHDVVVDPADARRIAEAFFDAAASGSIERLIEMLTEDATGVSDGAGLTEKLLQYSTPERLAAAARGALQPTAAKRRLVGGSPTIHAGIVNGSPAVLAVLEDRVMGLVLLDLRDGKIATIRGMASAHRLGRVTEFWQRGGQDGSRLAEW